ncbi:hypothetical protein VP01_5384g2 [Puccinia sorghi]|uniref:Integrase catalytic domain-containing protein n=1 Tax=Puccinia sorghi TaxID=27349 RepID=A0A0L6UJY7_9BASI|nr:hypothetical protein VP01_5384g2 [Puccinia sorghi]
MTSQKQLLHLDLIGPISPFSHRHDKYILTIVESNTRFAIDIEAKRLGYYLSILHSDRGTGFTNQEISKYFREHVIRKRFSDNYTPQQNGLAERFNWTVIELLRTMISCVLCINQIPTHKSKKSPYKLFKGATIPLNFFKTMGNLATVLSNTKKSKLEPRGYFGKLIGLNAELKS